MSQKYDLYNRHLREKGLSRTFPRKAVFEALISSGHRPLSTLELISMCDTLVNRASVYRAIEALENAGIIKRVYHGWKYKLELSDEFQDHHHHMTCIICGDVHATHDDKRLEKVLREMSNSCNYKMTDHHVEIRGICQKCQDK